MIHFDTQHLNLICIISYFDIFLFSDHYFHYNIYTIILLNLHRTAGTSLCLLFTYLQYIYCSYAQWTATIHVCCLIISHNPPIIRANVASLWYTDTEVSAIHWYLYYCYFFIALKPYSGHNKVIVYYIPTLR